MAQLIPLPEGTPIDLAARDANAVRSDRDGSVLFIVTVERRHWVLFDVSGTTRVDARPVVGGATTLAEGALIRAGERRLRLRAALATAEGEHAHPLACGFCRGQVGVKRTACQACGRVHDADCLAFAKRCGRCGASQ